MVCPRKQSLMIINLSRPFILLQMLRWFSLYGALILPYQAPIVLQPRFWEKNNTHLSTSSHTSNILNWVLFTLPNTFLLTFYTFITNHGFLMDTFLTLKTRSSILTLITSYISMMSLHEISLYKVYISPHITEGEYVSGEVWKHKK